jgi:hypothetical protein
MMEDKKKVNLVEEAKEQKKKVLERSKVKVEEKVNGQIEDKLQILKKNINEEIRVYLGMRKIKGKLVKIDNWYNLYILQEDGSLKIVPIRKLGEFDVKKF